MKKIIVFIVAMLLVVIVYFYFQKPDEIQEKIQSQNSGSTVQVTATWVTSGDLNIILTAPATIRAYQKGIVKSETKAKITRILVENGELINRGDTLIILDDTLPKIELDRSRGEFFKALTEFLTELKVTDTHKYEEWSNWFDHVLHKKILPPLPNSLSQSTLVAIVRYNIHQYYACVKEAEQIIQRCTIEAPFSGAISNVLVYPGEELTPGQECLTLTELSEIQVEINLLDKDIVGLSPNASFYFAEFPDDFYRISSINPDIDDKTHTGKALAQIHNKYGFKDGQNVMVNINAKSYQNRLTVPKEAVLTRNNRNLVFIVKSGIAKWQYVDLGVSNDRLIEITKGISNEDTVLISGHYSLAHDVPVNVNMEPR